MKVGDTAPDFELPAATGGKVKISDLIGAKGLVVFFYPKNNTKVCTAEACSFRDNFGGLKEAGFGIVGISGDSVASHESFSKSLALPFPTLSDSGLLARSRWQVPKTLGFIPGRVTYILDAHMKIVDIYSDLLNADRHLERVLQVTASMS